MQPSGALLASVAAETVIVGAGAAGLAVGASLRHTGRPFVLLEQEGEVGPAWRRHYDRLHLHTDKAHSALPFRPFPSTVPRYPSRQQVVRYLEDYAAHFDLAPRFGQRVEAIRWRHGQWATHTQDTCYRSANLVVATGYTRVPHIPTWPGQDTFPGPILHSAAYRNGRDLRGRRVLVVGFGNSGGEIALDLLEHGAQPTLAVRNPVNVVPRDLLGLPILAIAILVGRLPTRVADALTAPILHLYYGDLHRYGLRKLPYGPLTQIARHASIPLLDVGTMRHLRAGHIAIRPGLDRFEGDVVVFDDGSRNRFDAVVLATGYRPRVHDFLKGLPDVFSAAGTPAFSGDKSPAPGLYFCGFYVAPTGMLREISREAPRIAEAIAGRSAAPPPLSSPTSR